MYAMLSLDKSNISPDILQEHKDVLDMFLMIGTNMWVFDTTELPNKENLYNHPAIVDGLITVLSYMQERNPSGWKSMIPSFDSITALEEWIYGVYIEEIALRKTENRLTADQLQSYDKELQAMQIDLAKRKNWISNRIAWIDISYAPMRWRTIKSNNPGEVIIHKKIEQALSFIPRQTTMLANTLNDSKLKQFMQTHKEQIDFIKPILSQLSDLDQDRQAAIFASLLVCKLDVASVQDLVSKLSHGIQSGDYYDFVSKLQELVLSYATAQWENSVPATSTREWISYAKLKIEELHDGKKAVWLAWIHKPNPFLLPEDCGDLWWFLNKNSNINLFEILLVDK